MSNKTCGKALVFLLPVVFIFIRSFKYGLLRRSFFHVFSGIMKLSKFICGKQFMKDKVFPLIPLQDLVQSPFVQYVQERIDISMLYNPHNMIYPALKQLSSTSFINHPVLGAV